MECEVKRIYNCNKYCISHVYINGTYICDALEDTDRMLDDSMSVDEIKRKKVYCETAIPTGTYELVMNIVSPKYSKNAYYKKFCNGRMPRLLNVKGFDGILWHKGNSDADSCGCLLLGYNKVKGKVINSQIAFEKVYKILSDANKKGEKIIVKYRRTY